MPAKTVLIVDDSPSIRKMVSFAMKKIFKFEKELQAEDGLEALNTVVKEKIDLIICDVNMPNMNGLEFLKKIKSDIMFKRIPIIMLTTEDKEEDKKLAMDLGANCYLIKPFKPENLRTALIELKII